MNFKKQSTYTFQCLMGAFVSKVPAHYSLCNGGLWKQSTYLWSGLKYIVWVDIDIRGGGRGWPPPRLEKFQGKLCFHIKRKLLKNPEW